MNNNLYLKLYDGEDNERFFKVTLGKTVKNKIKKESVLSSLLSKIFPYNMNVMKKIFYLFHI